MAILKSHHVLTKLSGEARTHYVCYSCSCKAGQDSGVCKHVLYEGLRKRRFLVPDGMDIATIGRKPQQGAPTKTADRKRRQRGGEAYLGYSTDESSDEDTDETVGSR
jgi:hypothetical protein